MSYEIKNKKGDRIVFREEEYPKFLGIFKSYHGCRTIKESFLDCIKDCPIGLRCTCFRNKGASFGSNFEGLSVKKIHDDIPEVPPESLQSIINNRDHTISMQKEVISKLKQERIDVISALRMQ